MEPDSDRPPGTAERPHSINIALTAIGILVTALGVLIAYLTYHTAHEKAGILPIVVFAESGGGSPIADAEVSLNVPALVPEHTDQKGQVTFRLPREIVGLDGRIFIHKEGFENYNQQILLEPRGNFYPIYLKKISPPAPVATRSSSTRPPQQTLPPTGSAITKGDHSPAVVGSGNSVTYGVPETPEKKATPPK